MGDRLVGSLQEFLRGLERRIAIHLMTRGKGSRLLFRLIEIQMVFCLLTRLLLYLIKRILLGILNYCKCNSNTKEGNYLLENTQSTLREKGSSNLPSLLNHLTGLYVLSI